MKHLPFLSILPLTLFILAGCCGTRMLKVPKPLVITDPLASASDQRLLAHLDAVIYRDGPGTWAKNADWDEYIIGVENVGRGPLRITGLAAVDSLGTVIGPQNSRRQLVKGTKEAKRRYKDEGLEVRAGLEPLAMLGAGTLLTVGTSYLAGITAYICEFHIASATIGNLSGLGSVFAMTYVAVGGIVLVPAFAMHHAVNNRRVNRQIASKRVLLPLDLRECQTENIHIFFPLTPSPRQVEISYVDSWGAGKLIIDTNAALNGLHLKRLKVSGLFCKQPKRLRR